MAHTSASAPIASRPLALEGADNVRDLGGYPVSSLGSKTLTASRVFLRSDALAELTDADIGTLISYGLTTVIDLRSPSEVREKPDPFGTGSAHPEVREEHVSLLDHLNSSNFSDGLPSTLARLYSSILDTQAAGIRRAMTLLASAPGCALFHCSAGKDRTGVIAMLLLKIAGVPDEAVVEDYAATDCYMGKRFARKRAELRQTGIDVPNTMFASKPESMEGALEHLAFSYGTVERYLTQYVGCTCETIETIKSKLLGNSN